MALVSWGLSNRWTHRISAAGPFPPSAPASAQLRVIETGSRQDRKTSASSSSSMLHDILPEDCYGSACNDCANVRYIRDALAARATAKELVKAESDWGVAANTEPAGKCTLTESYRSDWRPSDIVDTCPLESHRFHTIVPANNGSKSHLYARRGLLWEHSNRSRAGRCNSHRETTI